MNEKCSRNIAGNLFVFFSTIVGRCIDRCSSRCKKEKYYQAHMQMDLLLCLEYFGVLRYLFLYRGCTLEKLSMVWLLATITICVVSILANKKAILGCFKHKRKSGSGHKAVKIAMAVTAIAILFSVVCVKPQMEQTVQTVMTSIDTNSAYIYQPYTGEQYPATQMEKIFSPYEMLYAVTAWVSGLHPALLIKVILPLFILPIFYVLLLGNWKVLF